MPPPVGMTRRRGRRVGLNAGWYNTLLVVAADNPCWCGAGRHLIRFDINAVIDYIEIVQSGNMSMSSITIRNLDSGIKERLRVRAAEHGHSMEAEARRILQTSLIPSGKSPGRNLYDRIHERFAPLGGLNLELPPRDPAREPPRFD